jgi:hypothetical protein
VDVADTGLAARSREWGLAAEFNPIGPEPIDEVGFALASTPELAFEGDQATPQPHPGLAAFPR